jgi:metal transporter CNNM
LKVAKIIPVLSKHHWLLVTLLFCNALALEALPIFLDRVVPSAYAVLISVVAVLIVGEVIPQAICIGPQQLKIAEKAGPIVNFLMKATAPVSWPIAKLLDMILGEHKITRFNASQLNAIIDMHSKIELDKIEHEVETKDFGNNQTVGLNKTQQAMITGVLNWKSVQAQ